VRIHNNEEFLTSFQNFNHSVRMISEKSKYCKIVHADDWIFPECICQMVRVAEEHTSVGVVGSYRLVETEVKGTGLPYSTTVVSGKESARMNLLKGPYTIGTPSGLLIRSHLIRSREKLYNELEAHQCTDAEAYYDLMQDGDFGFVHQVLSFTRHHQGSVTSSLDRFNAMLPSLFYCFNVYGPRFLSEAEFTVEKRKKIKSYYRFLGSRITQFSDREFWDFHKDWLERIGVRFNWSQVIWSAMIWFFGKMINVKQNLKSIINIFRQQRTVA
jgi:hypothetical protein